MNLKIGLKILGFRVQLLLQGAAAKLVDFGPSIPSSSLKASAFMASLNTLPALRVALGTFERVQGASLMPLLIADNASSDGSVAFLEAYAGSRPNVRLILHDAIQWHGVWIDRALQEAGGDLLFVLDSDLIFLGRRLLERCCHYMNAHPECWILQADSWESRHDIRNSAADGCIQEEALSTWFLCIRTGLRERVESSFVAVFPEQQARRGGRQVMSDTGAKVVAAMRDQGLEIHSLPRLWRWQFHHVGSLSWLRWANDSNNSWMRLKQSKMRHLDRWGRRLWPAST